MAEKVPDIVGRCQRDFGEDSKHHDAWVQKVDGWYKTWRGVLERADKAAEWRNQPHPPYVLQIVETLVAGLVDPHPSWDVKPRPKMGDPSQIETLRDGAKALSLLLAYQRDVDSMVAKQRAHRLQGLIAGLTVWKTYWRYEERTETRKRPHAYVDETGEPRIGEVDEQVALPVRDDPCVEVVDVRDFIWPESATSIERSPRLHHRVWMTLDDIKKAAKDRGWENVDQIPDPRDQSAADQSQREQSTSQADRTRGLVPVVEHWIENGARVVTIANQNVLLSDRPNPFKHGQFPFIAASPIPDLFRIPGVSVVELVEDLQKMLWSLQGQRLDNLEIINNAIVLVPEDAADPSSFVFAPGEQWLVPDPNTSAKILEMPTFPAQVSLEAEANIKADIQNIPGASPALLGQSEGQEQTATEISLLTNLAQRRLANQKLQFTLADIAVAEQWIELNRQFLTEPRFVAVVGKDGDEGWELIDPSSFNEGQFAIDIEQMDESLIRQERLAEANARLQIALTAVPVMAQIGQPLNMKAFVDDVLEAAGVQDTERYYSASPQAPGMAQGQGQPQPPGQPGESGGVSAPQAFDMNSPSNQFSQSPVGAMQQMLALSGGPVNA